MVKEVFRLQLKNGLEARPAALFVQIASRYESHVSVVVNEKQVNAKSIMGMMSLGSLKSQEIEIIAEGKDEQEAVQSLIQFLESQEEGK